MRTITLGLLLAAISLLSSGPAGAWAPSAPAVSSTGSYTVTFNACAQSPGSYYGCTAYFLEEKAPGGSWTYVTSSGSSKSFANKASGTYGYRVWAMWCSYYTWECLDNYSSPISVRVATAASPRRDPLETQLGYRYQARRGDINGDGRTDLFVKRIAGGVAGNGTIDAVILRQRNTGTFATLVPSVYQSSVASGWPVSSAGIAVSDFNVDGFVDVQVKGVSGAVGRPGALDQIIYSSGSPSVAQPLGLRPVDDSLKEFVGNSLDYFVSPNYFTSNAPLVWYSAVYTHMRCGRGVFVSIDDPHFLACNWSYSYVYGTYPDYSAFSPEALSIWSNQDAVASGRASTTQAVNETQDAAEEVFDVAIGGWPMEEMMGSNGQHTDPDSRKGLETFLAILGIARANADEIDTDEAPRQAPRSGSQVYLTMRKILMIGDHSALEHNTVPSVPCLTNAVGCQTISAFPDPNGSAFMTYVANSAADTPHLMMTISTVERGSTPSSTLWNELRANAAHYNTERVPYHFNCSGSSYNSNGFLHGLVDSIIANPNYDMNRFWCGEKPVPSHRFR